MAQQKPVQMRLRARCWSPEASFVQFRARALCFPPQSTQSYTEGMDADHLPVLNPTISHPKLVETIRKLEGFGVGRIWVVPASAPPHGAQQLFAAPRVNQPQIDRFVGTFAGTLPVSEFYEPENLGRIMGTEAQSAST